MIPSIHREIVGGATAPNWTNLSTGSAVGGWGFLKNQDDQTQMNIQLPHGVKPGSVLKPHIHWSPVSATGGDVEWEFSWAATGIDGTFTNLVTETPVLAPAGTAAGKHIITTFPDISGHSTPSAAILCRLRRLRNTAGRGTYDNTAVLLFSDFHVLIDRDGTTTVDPPWDT